MSERRPSLLFRFAGLFTLAMLALMSLAYGFLVPQPAPPGSVSVQAPPQATDTDDPRWAQAKAWVEANPGTAIAVCEWPVDLPRGGRIHVGSEQAPSFWDQGTLVQVVPVEARGGLLRARDGAARAWVSWADGACTVWRPQTVRVEGIVEDEAGTPVAPATIDGCGTGAEAREDGTFDLVLERAALAAAEPGPDGAPRCTLTAGKTRTPVELGQGGVVQVSVR